MLLFEPSDILETFKEVLGFYLFLFSSIMRRINYQKYNNIKLPNVKYLNYYSSDENENDFYMFP